MTSRQLVCLPLGQCGNQIGARFYQQLAEESKTSLQATQENEQNNFQNEIVNRFFRHRSSSSPLYARSVLVDMEPKVIDQSIDYALKGGLFQFDSKRIFTKQSGSGNNWAYGYSTHGPRNWDTISNLIRSEVEECDQFGGFVILQSLAGGTGSGVGTFITEQLRDEFPSVSLINQVIWPYSMGEVIVQNYNSSLTLSHLSDCSDGLIVTENDDLSTICMKLMGETRPSFEQLNQIVAQNLSNIFLPSYHTSALSSSASVIQNTPIQPLDEMITHLFSHSAYKLSSLRSIPHSSRESKSFQSLQWNYLIKHSMQMLIANAGLEEGIDWGVKIPPALAAAQHHSPLAAQQYASQALANGVALSEASIAGPGGFSASGLLAAPDYPTPQEEFLYRLSKNQLLPKSIIPEETKLQTTFSSVSDDLRMTDRNRRKSKSLSPEAAPSSIASRSLATMLFLRGSDCHLADASPFLHPNLYSSFSINPLSVARHPVPIHGDSRIACVWSNSGSLLQPLNSMLNKVWKMYQSKAYLHHYSKFGVEQDEFQQCFLNLEQICTDYQAL
jgi:tubulin delta